ncbi:MAG TPA: hypothetical protein VIP77_22660 [Jiangellaceae bacterium]
MPRPMTRESLASIHARDMRAHQEACATGYHAAGSWQTGGDGRLFWDCFWCGHRHRNNPATAEEVAAEDRCDAYRKHLDRESRRPPTRIEQAAAGVAVSVPAAEADRAGVGFPVVFTPAAWNRCGCNTPTRLAGVLADLARALNRGDGNTARFFALRSIAIRATVTTDRDGTCITVQLPQENP